MRDITWEHIPVEELAIGDYHDGWCKMPPEDGEGEVLSATVYAVVDDGVEVESTMSGRDYRLTLDERGDVVECAASGGPPAGGIPVGPAPLHRANQPGATGTQIVICPDCGQMEIWSEQECSDHGLCRRSGKPCPVCGQSLA